MRHICVPLGYTDPKKPALRGLFFLRAPVSLLKGPLHVAYAATRCAICLPLGVKGAPEWGCLCAPDAFSACRVPAICGHPQHDGAFFPDRAVPWPGTPDLCGACCGQRKGYPARLSVCRELARCERLCSTRLHKGLPGRQCPWRRDLQVASPLRHGSPTKARALRSISPRRAPG